MARRSMGLVSMKGADAAVKPLLLEVLRIGSTHDEDLPRFPAGENGRISGRMRRVRITNILSRNFCLQGQNIWKGIVRGGQQGPIEFFGPLESTVGGLIGFAPGCFKPVSRVAFLG